MREFPDYSQAWFDLDTLTYHTTDHFEYAHANKVIDLRTIISEDKMLKHCSKFSDYTAIMDYNDLTIQSGADAAQRLIEYRDEQAKRAARLGRDPFAVDPF